MKLLKELFELASLSEGKKKSMKITIDTPKPRGKHVNDVLRSKKGGRMKSPTDFDRNAVKRDTQAALHEAEADEGYFWYSAMVETKNRGGDDGPETTDHRYDGAVMAGSADEARAKAKRMYPRAYDIQVGPTTKARYDREMERP
jgi:hypothetical protein